MLVGLGPLLDRFSVDVQGQSLHASTQAPTDDLARAVKRIVDSRAPKPPASSTAPGPRDGG